MKNIFLMVIIIITVAYAQTSEGPLVIPFNLKIGDVLDSLEREQFYKDFLPAVKGFKQARILKLSNNEYLLEVHYWRDGQDNLMNMSQSRAEIEALLKFFGETRYLPVDTSSIKVQLVSGRDPAGEAVAERPDGGALDGGGVSGGREAFP